jgi:peptidoglycan hydrolase-like protein with peptidoglycan-binding domain
MAEQLGLGEIIKNFLGIGQEDKEPSGAVTSSLRPKARPEGLMASTVKPKIRPEDDNDDDKPTDPIAATTNTITMMNNYDDSEDEDQGVELDSASLQELLINPNSLYDRHSTTVRRLSRFGNEVPKVMQQKLKSPVVNDLLVDVTTMLAKEQSASKPPEPEMSVDPISEEPVKLNNKQIQQKLVDAGYNIKVDGVIGPQTKKAIKAFQKEKGLKVDGVVGKNTTTALTGVPEIKTETLEPGEVIYDDDFLAQQELASVSAGLMSPIITEPTTEELTEKQTVAVNEAAILGFPISIADIIPAHFKQFVGSVTGSAVNDVKTEDFFKDSELEAMNSVIQSNIVRLGNEEILKKLKAGEDLSDVNLSTKQVQAKLVNLGFLKSQKDIDGAMGPKTIAAIKSFQKKFELEPDGKVGAQTTNKILRVGAAEYKDYTKGLKDVGWIENVDPLSLFDQEGAVKKTLGQFNWRLDDNNNILVTDQYNFNNAAKMQKNYPTDAEKRDFLTKRAGAWAAGNLSFYGWLRDVGALYGTRAGEGTKFEIDLGKIK